VAISAAMLIGLGFRPLQAAGLALIANTAPVAFGALGIPIITLATVTGLPVDLLSAMVGRILVLFCVAVPFWVVWAMCGRKQMMEVWPACLTAGSLWRHASLISNYIGPSLAAIGASVVSMSRAGGPAESSGSRPPPGLRA
jgi:lactate permease